ncbi:MAG: hypothetical protein Kow0089_06910 [Desulfobulbaceae bacterium]
MKLSPIGEIIVQGDAEHAIPALNYCLARTERTIRRKLEKHRDSPVRLPRKREAKEEELPLSFSADKETKDKGQFNEKHHKNT